MKEKRYLQTVISGCAWCQKVIGVENHEVELKDSKLDNLLMLSHGICLPCKGNFEENIKELEIS